MLETNYGGLKLKNPLIVASATPTINLECVNGQLIQVQGR